MFWINEIKSELDNKIGQKFEIKCQTKTNAKREEKKGETNKRKIWVSN